MNPASSTNFSSMSLPPMPSWTNGFLSPKQQSSETNRSRANTDQDSPISVYDIYPTVSEIPDEEGLPPLPDISIRRPQMHARSKSAGTQRAFRDEYVMTRPIFRTTHCCIWECVHRRSGHRYCVKVLKDEDGTDEVETLMAVQYHPNICRFYESVKELTKVYMVMEMYNGGNLLSHVVQNGVMNEDSAVNLIRQILHGVLHLHETKGMIHGNITADNILLHNDRHAVLADFGAAPKTSRYLAREQEHSFASDMYGVGVVLHCMLMGDTAELTEFGNLSRLCKQFLVLLLHEDPDVRPTVREALMHEFLTDGCETVEELEVDRPPPGFVRRLLRRRKAGSSSAASTVSSCQS